MIVCFESTKTWIESWRPSPSLTFSWIEENVGFDTTQDLVFPIWTRWDTAPSNEVPNKVSVAPPEVGEFAPDIDVTMGGSSRIRKRMPNMQRNVVLPFETKRANRPRMWLFASKLSNSWVTRTPEWSLKAKFISDIWNDQKNSCALNLPWNNGKFLIRWW